MFFVLFELCYWDKESINEVHFNRGKIKYEN